MPRPSQHDKILDAALECFAEQGYEATRIRAIAQRAGVSEGALYRHYESKEAIAQSLYASHLQHFAEALQQVISTPESIEQRIRACIALVLAKYRENPPAFVFVILRQPAFMPQLPPTTIYPIDLIEHLIAEGQVQGAIRSGQANVLAAILLGCVLRPIILSQLADPGALDLLGDHQHDAVIADAAWGALAG